MHWQNSSLTVVTTEQLLTAFEGLDPSNYSDCNNLLHNFGPGNIVSPQDPFLHIIDKPYERLAIYEHIMHELHTADQAKYERMHKGTLYFFVSWLAFTIKDYEKAFFYMDSAMSEDINAVQSTSTPDSWKATPAAKFFLLDPGLQAAAARSIMQIIETKFQNELNRFNSSTGANLTLLQFRNSYVIPNMQDNSFRSIISGLYVFIMEYSERTYMIRLKGGGGGSIEPFLIHLFKGCLIFESLLKTEYSGVRNTLGDYLSRSNALIDLEIGQNSSSNPIYRRDQPRGGYTLQTVLGFLPDWRNENYKEKIIAITYAIRNTAGHDLSWPVSFDEVTYQEIYQAIVDSILWFIWKVKI